MTDPLGLIGDTGGVRPQGQQRNVGRGDSTQDFKKLLMDNIKQVNDLQQDAQKSIEDLQAGKRDDTENVILATQKADMAFKMLQQVRNKMMDAFNEIKEMRV